MVWWINNEKNTAMMDLECEMAMAEKCTRRGKERSARLENKPRFPHHEQPVEWAAGNENPDLK